MISMELKVMDSNSDSDNSRNDDDAERDGREQRNRRTAEGTVT